MTRAAGGGRDVEVEDVELGVPDCYGDSLDFDELVVGFGGEVCEADGVVDQEGKTAAGVALAVLSYKIVAGERWNG